MIIKWPGMQKNIVDDGLHYNLDLLPTLADVMNVKTETYWDGQSYSDTLKTGAELGRPHLIISQNAHVCQRSARFDDWLYTRTYHDGYHLFDKEMLFNLKKDPYEQVNLRDEKPEVCAKAAKMILDWQDDQMMKDPTNKDPMWTVMSEGGPEHSKTDLKAYIERLESTGRSEGASILRKRYKI